MKVLLVNHHDHFLLVPGGIVYNENTHMRYITRQKKCLNLTHYYIMIVTQE